MQSIESDWHANPVVSRNAKLKTWTLFAATLALSAFLVINLHLPTDDDWFTIGTIYRERSHLLEFAFLPLEHHWHPLFYVGPSLGVLFDGAGPFGLVLIRILNALGLFGSIAALGVVARALGVSRAASAFGMAVFTFHQATVGVLRQWDSFGQLWGDAIFHWVFAILVLAALGRQPRWTRGALGALLIGIISLVASTGTERVLGSVCGSIAWFFPMTVSAIVVRVAGDQPVDSPSLLARRRLLKDVGPLLLGIVFAVLVFLTLRSSMGAPTSHGGRYGIGSIATTARNVAQMMYAVFTPVSTLKTFEWWTTGQRAGVGVAVAITGLVGAFVAVALFRRGHHRALALSALVASVAACFPTALAGHVSEHYVAESTFFFAIALMVAIDSARTSDGRHRGALGLHPAIALGLTAFFALHVHGFISKELTAAASGERDLRDGKDLFAQLKHLPDGVTVGLEYQGGLPKTYSLYSSHTGYEVLLTEAARHGKKWARDGAPPDVIVVLDADGDFYVRYPGPR